MSTETDPEVVWRHYCRAIDEVYMLRKLLAFEASVLVEHLGYASYPKGRRKVTEKQVERMRQAARGDAGGAVGDDDVKRYGKRALHEAGAETGLTNYEWEREQQQR